MRLRRHLASVTAKYPRVWEQLANFRRDKSKLGGWPAWCDVPLSGAYAIATAGRDGILPTGPEVAVIGGLGTWRMTQGVYRYDPDLLDALWTTPIEQVPIEMLYRVPEWCVYLETPGRMAGRLPLLGSFLWLEWDTHPPHRTELRALLDTDDYLLPLILHLTSATLDTCIDAALAETLRWMPEEQSMPSGTWQDIRSSMREIWPPLISLALYLCSEGPDVMGERGELVLPERPRPRKGGGIVPASSPCAWVIGSRIGAALRVGLRSESAGGRHASPRPHVRRAHWATYWTGPKTAPQKPLLHWLHPILVGAGQDLPVTIHPVADGSSHSN